MIQDRQDNEPYLERYYLFLKDRKRFPFNVFLHKFLKGDPDDVHDHPWPYCTVILAGGYYEWIPQFDSQGRKSCEIRHWRGPGHIRLCSAGSYHRIELKPGVMFCLRRFHELITDLVRGAWLRYVRRFNAQALGEPNDLDQFLFGAERAPLEKYLPILREVQEARCLYCEREVAPGAAHIDHFIPWSRYPIDLGHNFVLAHAGCNGAKADHLAAGMHLGRWVERNRTAAAFLQERFDQGLIVHSAQSSERIARWAYSQAASTHGMAWVKSREFQPIDESCVHLLS